MAAGAGVGQGAAARALDGRRGRRVELDTLLGGVPHSMAELSEVIGRHYFSHADLGMRIEEQMPQRYLES